MLKVVYFISIGTKRPDPNILNMIVKINDIDLEMQGKADFTKRKHSSPDSEY